MLDGRSKLYKPMLGILALALLFSVSITQRQLNRQRDVLGLTRLPPLENAPPLLTFTTVALGGFRGLIANALWIRATELQDEDKYFEMVQLADWITKLQPHFKTVWVHQAWNMAYNISVKFNDYHDRWLWVLRGIELLRDEGLKYNPGEPLIYRELGWFFQHKMGHYLDDAHEYYKQVWAAEMTEVLGAGRPNFAELLNPTTEDARRRVRILREKYKMDPVWMKKVDDEYGPLEWRLPETHAIYWATLGLEKSARDKALKKEDIVQLRRVVFQSMQLAFQRGKLIFPTKGDSHFIYGPNLEIVKQASDSYEEMAALDPDNGEQFLTGHRNFLLTAVYFLYTHNRRTAANQWFDYAKKKYPTQVPQFTTVDQYALSRVAEDMEGSDPIRFKAILEGMIETFYLDLAIGEEDEAQGYLQLARKFREAYESRLTKGNKERVALPTIETFQREVLDRLLSPEAGLDPIVEAQLRTRLGLPKGTNAPPASLQGTNSPAARTNEVKKASGK
jgi:hypothetical protein